MASPLSVARGLTEATLAAASVATVGIGVYLATGQNAAASVVNSINSRIGVSNERHHHDDGGFGGSTVNNGVGGSVSGSHGGSQTRTSGS